MLKNRVVLGAVGVLLVGGLLGCGNSYSEDSGSGGIVTLGGGGSETAASGGSEAGPVAERADDSVGVGVSRGERSSAADWGDSRPESESASVGGHGPLSVKGAGTRGVTKSNGQSGLGAAARALARTPASTEAGGGKPVGVPTSPGEAGGSANPNDRELGLVYFQGYGVNPFVDVGEDALSTFALDGDTASWALSLSYLEGGIGVVPEMVRVEEWVNAFEQGYESGENELDLAVDGGPSLFGEEGYQLVRVGVVSPSVEGNREPVSVVFVIDVSGSMSNGGRLKTAQEIVIGMVDGLGAADRAGVVIYGDEGKVLQPMVGSEEFVGLQERVRGLRADGSTFAAQGITMGYRLGKDELDSERNVRLILVSDGVGNVGQTGAEGILELVDDEAVRGAALSAVGVGWDNYNDVLLEVLANRGNGTYHYVRSVDEAEAFVEGRSELLLRQGPRDARVQVEFNGEAVRKYRLIGYENRSVADSAFRDDSLDFGEPGFGRDVVGLYEVRLWDEVLESAELLRATVRWQPAGANSFEEKSVQFDVGDLSVSWSGTDGHFRRAAVVAEFAELMRGSYWANCGSLKDVGSALREIGGDVGSSGSSARLERAVELAESGFVPYCNR